MYLLDSHWRVRQCHWLVGLVSHHSPFTLTQTAGQQVHSKIQYIFLTLTWVHMQRSMAEGGIVKFSPIEMGHTVSMDSSGYSLGLIVGSCQTMGIWLRICTKQPDHPPSLLGFTFNSTAIPPFQVQGLFVAMDDPYLLKRLMVLPLGYIWSKWR